MYLSRVEIDTNDRQKISDLTHLGSYHNWVEQSFLMRLNKELGCDIYGELTNLVIRNTFY